MRLFMVIAIIIFAMPMTGFGWAEGTNILLDPYLMCKKTRRLHGRMADICRHDSTLLKEIINGIHLGFRECAYQFQHRRWNCTAARKSMRKILMRDTRETGYVNAITAAGVTYAVTKVCTSGNLMECSCDRQHSRRNGGQPQMVNAVTAVGAFVRKQADFEKKRNESCRRRRKQRGGISDKGGRKTPHRRRLLKNVQMPEGEWEWGGCSDNINFGLKHSRTFLDSRYRRKSDLRTLVKLHNNMAGRLAIRDSMRLECKCHGLSGSCTVKTCWLKMPPFREVASRLIDRFDHAHKVVLRNDGNSFMTEGGLKFLTKSGQRRHLLPARHDLVYSDESPEFCAPNARTGSLGTTHRECLANSTGVEGCDQLCCSRGHRHRILTEWVNCRCAFKWCCEVTCDKCLERREVNTCL